MTQSAFNLDALNNLTIILPTFGSERRVFAAATVRQWAPTSAQFIVADGNPAPDPRPFQGFANVTYLHDSTSFELRLARAAELIHTDFAILMSDDDVFIPSVIAACTQALQSEPDYAAISPFRVRVAHTGNWYSAKPSKNIRWNNAGITRSSRLAYLGHNYTASCIYGVCRSAFLQASFASAAKRPVPIYAFGELHHEFFMNALGKVRITPQVGWIRRSVATSVYRKDDFDSTWLENSENENRHCFIDGLSSALAETCSESETQIRQDVEFAITAYARSRATRKPSTRQRALGVIRSTYAILPTSFRGRLHPVATSLKRRAKGWSNGWEAFQTACDASGIGLSGDVRAALQHRAYLEERLQF